MEEQKQALPKALKKTSKTKPILCMLLAVVLILSSGAGVYYWQHKKLNGVQAQLSQSDQANGYLKSEVVALNKQVSSLTSQVKSQTQSSGSSASQTNPVVTDNLNIKVLDGYRYYTTQYPNNPYIVVDVTLTNTGTSSLSLPASSFGLRDSGNNGGADFGDLVGTTMSNGKTILGDQTLAAGQTVTGGLTFSAFNKNYTSYTFSYKSQTFPVDASTSVKQ